ncbi:MAG TPA: sulfatase [Solirubrobacterales bacterium]|nr:sulfatase [Solirubrobacterales bacterium]
MVNGRHHRLGFSLAVLAATLFAWAAGSVLGTPAAEPARTTGSPPARAAATCGAKCQAARERRQRNRAELRRKNARQKRPNVILIDTDDQNVTDMFVMRKTLNLLGARGTTFRNSYVSYPLCCPSRATQVTGQYAHNHGVVTDGQYGTLDNTNTLAVWLKRAKYRTAMVGKYLNGYGILNAREVPPGWRQWFGLTGGTEQKRYGFKLNENGKVRNYGRKPANYVDSVLGAKVNGLLKAWAPSPKPFFLYYNPNNPHGEKGTPIWSTRDPEPAPRYLGAFGDIPAPRPPNFDESNVSDKPKQIRDIPRLSDPEKSDIDRRYRGRLESLLSVDDQVKKIVKLVRKYGDKRKTFFIFTSDNGLELGSHRIMFKNFLYEEGERVPLIIRGPGIPQNVTRDQLVANIDLAPTIVAITKARPGRVMDGINLLPLTQDPNASAHRDLLFESVDLGIYGLRRAQWSYNRYSNGDEELYNLNTDPYQLQNLLYDPLGPGDPSPQDVALADQLSARLAQLRTCSGASCR